MVAEGLLNADLGMLADFTDASIWPVHI